MGKAESLAGDDRAERMRIAIVRGAALSDTAHYAAAITALQEATSLAESLGESRQIAYALSMVGRAAAARRVACGDRGTRPLGPVGARGLDRVPAVARCVRLPDAYLWGKGYALDALCGLAAPQKMPQAPAWIDELRRLAARTGMREFSVRSHLHRATLGDATSAATARLLAA